MPPPPVTSSPLVSNSASPSNVVNKSLTEKIVHVPQVSYHNVQSYIKELEISEGQLSSCLRNVYDNNQKDEFMKQLDERVKRYDVEIEKLCNSNYQSFVDTFNELLTVREDAVQIKQQLVENDEKLQKIGQSLIKKVQELSEETKKQNNILTAIEALNKFLPVFSIYRQLKAQMNAKNYYPALKLLEDLENNYLPIIKQYRFSNSIYLSIPLFKEQIQSETKVNLNDFLENVRVESEKCGQIANQQMAVRLKIDKKYFLLEKDLNNENKEEHEANFKKLPFDVIDFSPLYKNLHMNQLLGSKSQFASYYRTQRQKQLKLILDAATENESLDAYKRYFHRVTGFFVIEDQILSSTEGLVDERYLDDLFKVAIPFLIKEIRKMMEQCKDAEFMLKVKIIVVLFCNTIEEAQFPTIQLSDLMKEIREKYYQMLLQKWDEKLRDIFNEDNYTCMEIDNEEAYNKLMQIFPCQLSATMKSKYSMLNFPEQTSASDVDGKYLKRMPYSACVPKIFIQIKEFVNNCVKFAEGLNSSKTELDDMIRKPTNKLITDKLNEQIKGLISKVSLIQLVQIVVNTIYLERSIELLEQHLLIVIGATSSKQSGKLQGISVFKDLRSEAEARIYDLLNSKIDELLDLTTFNWLMTESQGIASDYMKSLLSFLKSNLDSFNHLPSKLAQTACISACKHIAQSLTNKMLSSEVKAINFGAIDQINLDLLQCETFASSVQIHGLDNDTILLCFTDIRQLVDLILTKEWSIYLKDFGKADNKYNRVHGSTAINILEKLKEGMKKSRGLLFRLDIGGKPSEKDDVKLMESVLKQLKTLVAQNATF